MLILTCPNCAPPAGRKPDFHPPAARAHLKRFGPGSSDTNRKQYLFYA